MISVRNSKYAISGLVDMIDYIDQDFPVKDLSLLEIGSYTGDSTEQFCKRFSLVTSVDPWENGYDDNDMSSYLHDMRIIEADFDKRMQPYSNNIKCKMNSEYFAENLKNKFDVIYIDGIHTYKGVKKDINLFKDRALLYLCGHDYSPKFKGVQKAVDELGMDIKIFKDTSWLIKL